MAEQTYKVLIVDDDQFLLDIYSTKFSEQGYTVESAMGGEEALDKLRENNNFDAVLLDIVMPSMDGLQVLEKIRDEKLAGNTAVIVLSNQGQQTDIEKAKAFDIDGYIVKASTIPSEVIEEVEGIITKKVSPKK